MGDCVQKITTFSKGLLKNEELYKVYIYIYIYIFVGTPSSMDSSSFIFYSLIP